MIKEFQIQLKNAIPLTHEEYLQLEDTSFHIEDNPVFINLRYKYFFSRREKQVGDIVLLAVLATPFIDENEREDIELKVISIHPEELDNYELFRIQPTLNDTLLPVVVFKNKMIPVEVTDLLNKIVETGYRSLSQEEVNLLKKLTDN